MWHKEKKREILHLLDSIHHFWTITTTGRIFLSTNSVIFRSDYRPFYSQIGSNVVNLNVSVFSHDKISFHKIWIFG